MVGINMELRYSRMKVGKGIVVQVSVLEWVCN